MASPRDPAEPSPEGPPPAGEAARTPVRRPRRRRVVALTGAAAFLGSNLIGVLEEDPNVERVVAIDIEPPPTGGPKTRMYEVDLTVPASEERVAEILAAEGVDTLLHLAFLSTPTHASAWAHEVESVGTMHVLNAARQAKVSKVVLWSQTLLYGARANNPNFLTERHPLRASTDEPYFADKIAAERSVLAFGSKSRDTVVTILRTAPIVGPTVRNVVTRYLGSRAPATLLGFDPLWQFVHEVDAIAAFKLAIDRDAPGVFNIVGDGVLPLSTVLRLASRTSVPIPHPMARAVCGALWGAQLVAAPPSFLPYLRYVCVADGARAARVLGFRATYTTREALLDFVGAQRLREVRLLQEVPG
jgi:UDP-glucose 4-epimerase